MSEIPKSFEYTEADHAAYDALDRGGQLTGAQIRQRIGLEVAEHVDVEFVPEEEIIEVHVSRSTTTVPKARRVRPLSWREQLGADGPPDHIARTLR